jgi:hypothetical protein
MPAILFVPQSAKVARGSENLQAGCVKRRGRSCQLFDKTITHDANVHHLIKAMPSILLAPCGVNPGAEAIFWTSELTIRCTACGLHVIEWPDAQIVAVQARERSYQSVGASL